MKESYLVENLTVEMERLGFNDHSLAMKAGLKRDVVRDVLRGKTKQPAADKLLAIATALGRTVQELLHTRLPAASGAAEDTTGPNLDEWAIGLENPPESGDRPPSAQNVYQLLKEDREFNLLGQAWPGLDEDERRGMVTIGLLLAKRGSKIA